MPLSSRVNAVPVESLINVQREDGSHDKDHKVSEVKDEKMPNASIFTFIKEDHTLGNMLRTQMHTNEQVRFCGYKPDHPTVHTFFLKVQTEPGTTPAACVGRALREMLFVTRSFGNALDDAMEEWEESQRRGVAGEGMEVDDFDA